MKHFSPKRLILLGILLVISALLFGGYYLGVPYQDPTPQMQASWDGHMNIFNILLLAGSGLCIAGLAMAIIKRRVR